MRHIKGLDTVRAFAVLFVIVSHWVLVPVTGAPVWHFVKDVLLPDGSFGVTLFFVLSGFLITAILLNARERSIAGGELHIIKNFFFRRALRIFPIYYLLLAFVTILFLEVYHKSPRGIGYFATYTGNILMCRTQSWNYPLVSHTWSLAVEEQFYLIWPWVIIFTPRKMLAYVVALFVVAGFCSTLYTDIAQHPAFPLQVYNCFDAFGLGGLYAMARRNDIHRKKFEKVMVVLFWLAMIWTIFWNIRVFQGYESNTRDLFLRTVSSVISLGIIMFIVNNRSEPLRKHILENKQLNYVGAISYGLYLYHPTVHFCYEFFLDKMRYHFPGVIPAVLYEPSCAFIIMFALLLVVASISYRYIEQPILKLKDKFNYN